MRAINILKYLSKNIVKNSGFTRNFTQDSKINLILRQNEVKKIYGPGTAVKSMYANQIGAHVPTQDMWGEATSVYSRDIMLGVFDGNTGIACSHVVAKRLFKYMSLSLLPLEVLKEVVDSAGNRFRHVQVMRSLQDRHFFLEEYRKVYHESEQAFAKNLLSRGKELDVQDAIIHTFERLDEDLSKEALEDKTPNRRLLWVGMTGTGATLVHISGLEVTVGTAGDALVVVGTKSGEAKVLTPEHNVENREEVAKVLREHPDEPGVLDMGLLLGSLTSFRSFGNFRYKWSRDKVEQRILPVFGERAVPRNCKSPPYLTATPDISHYSLSASDSFMVIASDGIWDIFPPKRVVEIISKHKPVHWAKQKLLIPWKKLQELKSLLKNENVKEELDMEESPATQVILEALVATSKNLHLPKRFIRNIRDDMTVLVIFFDQEYLASHLNLKEGETKIKLPKPLMKIISNRRLTI